MPRMSMKMAAVSTIALLLLCCSVITSTDSPNKPPTCDHSVTVGDNYSVPLNYQKPYKGRLSWSRGKDVLFSRRSETAFIEGKKTRMLMKMDP
ncbi:hypothetical protein Q5P01_005660 [Channa striata]|uniref:Uncharacterized protein n=1 Tax=Channa striata TaxID=64152 RepID=A0AA88NJ43_CHASR|nr:hypothetical protein Q5P01_005660 [Channa striata]